MRLVMYNCPSGLRSFPTSDFFNEVEFINHEGDVVVPRLLQQTPSQKERLSIQANQVVL